MSVERARTLRKHMTAPELALWFCLRALKAQGWHFRRQALEGPYILDFVCRTAKLVIEVDGAHHGEDAQRRHDEQRDQFLRRRGFTVLRFWASDILNDVDIVVEQITAALSSRTATGISRARGAPNLVSPRHLRLTRLGLRRRRDN